MLGKKTLSFTLFNECNSCRNVTAIVIVVRGLPYKGIIGLDFLKKYGAKINLAKEKVTLCDGRRQTVHALVKGGIEYSDCQLIVTDYIELEPGSHQNTKCDFHGEVKNYWKNVSIQ